MPFELVEPESLTEALGQLDPDDPAVRAIAGGTALMLMIKSGFFRPKRLVSLRRTRDGLGEIRPDPQGGLRIGAMVRLSQLERSDAVRQAAPVIAATLRTHSNVRVRNVATVGGNLGHGDPHMDLPPVLIALGAEVEAASPRGRRRISVEDLIAGYFETVLANDEVITELFVPLRRRAAYVKCTARAADDWPALGIAVAVEGDGARLTEARVAIGAATERAMRLKSAEAVLTGAPLDERLIREAGRAAAAEAPVVADEHGSAAYKRDLVAVHLRRAIAGVLG
jgi:carbon-monoxide dehydrogenase medium subunit